MKDIVWLSPSLAAGAIARRLVVFFERRPQIRSRGGVERAMATTRLFIIGVPARCPTHQSGRQGTQMAAALTDRIVARYLRAAEQRERSMPVSEKTKGKTP